MLQQRVCGHGSRLCIAVDGFSLRNVPLELLGVAVEFARGCAHLYALTLHAAKSPLKTFTES